jgi:DNA polymerase I-like protein with 3'-5' exonuclease and polymerase domains
LGLLEKSGENLIDKFAFRIHGVSEFRNQIHQTNDNESKQSTVGKRRLLSDRGNDTLDAAQPVSAIRNPATTNEIDFTVSFPKASLRDAARLT